MHASGRVHRNGYKGPVFEAAGEFFATLGDCFLNAPLGLKGRFVWTEFLFGFVLLRFRHV
jgi:hypothetical protein